MTRRPDPFQILGVSPTASEVELRAAYRRLVQLHHPDHNNGSTESTRRFEEVQEAYAEIRRLRAAGSSEARPSRSAPASSRPAGGPPPRTDPDLEARLAAMENELKAARDARDRAAREARERAAREARERAAREAREAQEQALHDARSPAGAERRRDRPTDEELGYFSTDDSISKILDDAAAELSDRWSEARRSPAARRVSDLIDELASKLTGEPPPRH